MQRGRRVIIRAPFACDCPDNVELSDLVYVNRDVHLEGRGRIRVGRLSQLGPGVRLLTTTHPMDAAQRVTRGAARTTSLDVTVGEQVWIGAGALILPGVTIGDRSVIGAGSVVTRDIPADVLAVGNPARVVRDLNR